MYLTKFKKNHQMTCFATSAADTGCKIDDVACLCTTGQQALTSAALPCVLSQCSEQDASDTAKAATKLCEDALDDNSSSSSDSSSSTTTSSGSDADSETSTDSSSSSSASPQAAEGRASARAVEMGGLLAAVGLVALLV